MTARDKQFTASRPVQLEVSGPATSCQGAAPWPEFPSQRRTELTNFARAYRVAQRIHEVRGIPVAVLQQQCFFQSHCIVWGNDIFRLQHEGNDPVPYKVVTVLF